MLIRIFATQSVAGIEKYINFVRLEYGASSTWNIEFCDPMKWTASPGDLHIYIDVPIRLAVPWASYNVYAADLMLESWDWAKTEMDLVVTTKSMTDRATAIDVFRKIFRSAIKGSHPPMLPIASTEATVKPKVGIITLTRNRKDWWPNMLQNVLKQNWPMSMIEWLIVDDGDEGQRLGAEVDTFMERTPGVMIRYVEMEKPRSIGSKRNAAVEAASADVDIFVVMDDDDHYPADSIQKRLSWLTRTLVSESKGKVKDKGKEKEKDKAKVQSQVAYCSVLPMYDLTRYISAMNVPELELGPAERVSEATLVFTRAAWTARPFPDISMAEGIGFLEGREEISVEMPGQGIIVSFIHTKNSSSRRIPPEQEPNGCHYGFSDEYFKYLHQIGMAN